MDYRAILSITLLSILPAPAVCADDDGRAKANPRFVRIGHYQCVCKQRDLEANLGTVVKGLELASQANLDIVSFPETFLTGYFSEEKEARAQAFAIDSDQIKELLRRTARFEPLFMVGFNELRDGDLYNTVAVIEKGELLGRYSKAMPIYGYFKPGREFPIFEKKGLKLGVIICADGGYIEPTRILSIKGAQVIFAPHFNFVGDPVKHYQNVRGDHIARAVENGVYFIRANNVVPGRKIDGVGTGGYGYGDSYVLDPNGQIVAAAGLYHEYLMIYNLDLEKMHRSQHNRRSLKSATELLDALSDTVNSATHLPGRGP